MPIAVLVAVVSNDSAPTFSENPILLMNRQQFEPGLYQFQKLIWEIPEAD